jgi:hypothetical protein
MPFSEQTRRAALPPNLDLLSASQARIVADVLTDLTRVNFDRGQVSQQVPDLTVRIASACASDEDRGRMVDELDRWVRWRRQPGYWLAYLVQLAMQQTRSEYFALSCVLYADAQINVNSDLSLPSLENAHNALTDPAFHDVATMIDQRIRTVFNYYRTWYSATPYDKINQLTEHLYSTKTWYDLVSAFPELRKPRRDLVVGDYLRVIDQCDQGHDVYHGVLTRRFLGSVYEGSNELDKAAEQFRLALETAQTANLDTEIGHLHRLCGYALRELKDLDGAEREFKNAYAHESQPLFAYWQALSARELGDVWLRRLPHPIDRSNLPKQPLQTAMQWYRIGRDLLERHIAAGVLPVARAVEQQLFRSYVDNSIEVAVLAGTRDSVIEMEAAGPRYATDMIAEGNASATLDATAYAKYLECRAIFYQYLSSFSQGDHNQDFEKYLSFVEKNREARQSYMRTRLQLTSPITHAQLSDENVAKLFQLHLPDTAFLFFHIASKETYSWLLLPSVGMPVGQATRNAATWQRSDLAFQNVLRQAQCPPALHPELAVPPAIDTLLSIYEECFNPLLEPSLPALQDKHLKIFPRFSMNAVPLHAMKVNGKPLIDYCDVSYGQTLGMLFQVHRDTSSQGRGTLAALYDENGTVAYKGTFRMIDPTGSGGVSILSNSSWEEACSAIAKKQFSDLLFACHGAYDREDPANSYLRLRSGVAVPFSEIFSKFDLTGCRSVTLGACESGIARTLVSAEYIGLPVAFLAAGVRYVIATLWQTNQIAAAILLAHFYRLLGDGENTVVGALNEAQRFTKKMSQSEVLDWLGKFLPEKAKQWEQSIREKEDPPFGHPYYWASFYVTGDV